MSFQKKLEKFCTNLITISCPCHSAALVANIACREIPDYCEDFVKKLGYYINSSPKRSAIFDEFCECFMTENRKILKLSDTRWLSRHACIERLLELWDTIELFLREIVMSDKTKTGENLLCTMQKPDLKAYLYFLKHILHFLNSFNAFFQALETRIHLLQPKSFQLLIMICKHFLKPEFVHNISNNFEFSKEEYKKSLNDIYLGDECEKYLKELIIKGYANEVAIVQKNCLQFYVTAAQEICNKLPVNDKFLSKLKVFESDTALYNINRETSFNEVSFVAQAIGGFDDSGLRNEWFALYQGFTEAEKNKFSLKIYYNLMIVTIIIRESH